MKETCHERFKEFAQTLDKLDPKSNSLPYRNQAIKLIQLLRGCSTYKGIFQEVEALKGDDSFNEDEPLMEYQEFSNGRFYK